jgi:hypothetical protein
LIENDKVVARSSFTLKGDDKLGSHVFVLNGADQYSHGMHWSAITHHHEDATLSQDENVIQRIRAAPSFVTALRERMHPGMTLVLTDAPLSPDSRSGKDFVIVTTA